MPWTELMGRSPIVLVGEVRLLLCCSWCCGTHCTRKEELNKLCNILSTYPYFIQHEQKYMKRWSFAYIYIVSDDILRINCMCSPSQIKV